MKSNFLTLNLKPDKLLHETINYPCEGSGHY